MTVAVAPDAFGGSITTATSTTSALPETSTPTSPRCATRSQTSRSNAYAARRTSTVLEAISSTIEATMLADPIGTILGAVPDQVAGIVTVEVSDPCASVAQAIASQYGDAV